MGLARFVRTIHICEKGRNESKPMAFPTAQEIKVIATVVDFFVAPAMLRETIESASVWADQNDSVM